MAKSGGHVNHKVRYTLAAKDDLKRLFAISAKMATINRPIFSDFKYF